jgi:murein DD-endopeptidase MepM/ murein hydrolase activator NlpD
VKSYYTGTGPGIVTFAGELCKTKADRNADDSCIKGKSMGKAVIIEYRDASGVWESTTMHHREVLVGPGQRVAPGQVVAVGAGEGDQFRTSNAGPAHVHWSLKRNRVLVNPLNGEPLVLSRIP